MLSYFVNIACWVVVTCGCGNGVGADGGVAAGIFAADFRFEMDCETCSTVLERIGSGGGKHTAEAGMGVSFSGGVGVACSCTLTGPETST